MTDVTKISVTATAETALRKLKKAEIGVYNCKKSGARFIFSVKDKHIKKVFAIFSNPCYNISIDSQSKRNTLLSRLVSRIGLVIGGAVFIALAVISQSFVFRIDVTGSGSYLSPEVRRIIYESGVKEFKPYSGFDCPLATGKILALPQVTFCNIEKRGSILHVDVQVDEEHFGSVTRASLVSDKAGTVKNITAICGTALVSVGDTVKSGDALIGAYILTEESKTDCLAVGYAEIECNGKAEFFATEESEENLKAAYASVLIGGDEILTRSHTVTPCDGGVTYVIDFTYLHKLSINME